MRYLLILFTLLFLASCTSRGLYEGMQQAANRECDKYTYQSPEYEKCIENANISYDQYHQEISGKTKKP